MPSTFYPPDPCQDKSEINRRIGIDVLGYVLYSYVIAYREKKRLKAQSLRQNQRSREEDYYPSRPE
ncbi:hypothetical protein GCM10007389_39870 [Pontibacter akesuensis]|nr:hypothetical protein GCM10007389_39870 [Pontibacter akesuensis]